MNDDYDWDNDNNNDIDDDYGDDYDEVSIQTTVRWKWLKEGKSWKLNSFSSQSTILYSLGLIGRLWIVWPEMKDEQ